MVGTQGARPEKQIKLASFGPGKLDLGRYLSRSEADNYLDALAILRDHQKAASLIEIVRRNLSDFEAKKAERSRKMPDRGEHVTTQRESDIELNRLFLNYLAAVRTFLDHTETRLKRRYKHAPEVYDAFRVRTSQAFDNSFAYRFLYKLRNFSQHCGAPIGIVDHENKAIGSSGIVQHRLHLLFDAPQLLQDGGDIWGPVKTDLDKIKGTFPVDPLPEAVLTELEGIWEAVRQAEKPHLQAAAETTVSQVSAVNQPQLNPAVVRIWHRKNATTIEFLIPPVETMQWLGYTIFRNPT